MNDTVVFTKVSENVWKASGGPFPGEVRLSKTQLIANQVENDYRTYLLTVARRKPSTVNAHLTAIDDFYRRRGIGPAAARREELPKAAPRALDHRDQKRWLRAAEHASPRDKALAHVGSTEACG